MYQDRRMYVYFNQYQLLSLGLYNNKNYDNLINNNSRQVHTIKSGAITLLLLRK